MTCSADQTARLWETETFSLVQELKHDSQRWVWDAAFSADSNYLITGKLVLIHSDIRSSIYFVF